jgi:hypothetical protein
MPTQSQTEAEFAAFWQSGSAYRDGLHNEADFAPVLKINPSAIPAFVADWMRALGYDCDANDRTFEHECICTVGYADEDTFAVVAFEEAGSDAIYGWMEDQISLQARQTLEDKVSDAIADYEPCHKSFAGFHVMRDVA